MNTFATDGPGLRPDGLSRATRRGKVHRYGLPDR